LAAEARCFGLGAEQGQVGAKAPLLSFPHHLDAVEEALLILGSGLGLEVQGAGLDLR
jgi:hypothetical protein